MDDAVTSLAGPEAAQSSLLTSLTQRRQMPLTERQQRTSRSIQSSARVEKSTPLRSSLARRTLHRSNSSMSTYRKKLSTARPLSWHSSPQVSYQPVPHRDMVAYTSFPYADFHDPYSTQDVPNVDIYTPGASFTPIHEQYHPQYVIQPPWDCASGESSPYGYGQGQLQVPQWIDPALAQPMWTGPEPYHQAQYYDVQHEQDAYQPPSSNPDTTRLVPHSSGPSAEPLDKILVGLGLYDRDSNIATASVPASDSLFASSYQPPSPGKGLKLEESWQPSSSPNEDEVSEPATSPVPELESSPNAGEQPFDTEFEDAEDEHDMAYIPNDLAYNGPNHHQQQTTPYYAYHYANMDMAPRMNADSYGYGYTIPQESHGTKSAVTSSVSSLGVRDYTAAPVWENNNAAYWPME